MDPNTYLGRPKLQKFDCWFKRWNFTCAEPNSWRKQISSLLLKKGEINLKK